MDGKKKSTDRTVFLILHQSFSHYLHFVDFLDRHPLHLACMCGTSPLALKKIIDTYPAAAAMPDTPDHQLPLHIAVSHHANIEALRNIYGKNREDEDTVWKCVILTNPFSPLLNQILLHLDAYPDAIKCHTKTRGLIPLHMACSHKNADIDIVHFLLDNYKAGASVSRNSVNNSVTKQS